MANDKISLPAEGTGTHSIGAPLEVPVGKAGAADSIPGEWAAYAMKLPWKVARSGRRMKTNAIKLLTGAAAVREPLQRSTTQYTGKRLDERVGSKAANVESILIQIVGEVSQQECSHCLQDNGPWAKCIRFLDIDHTVTACGNCQWNGRETRCEFYQPPRVTDTPPPRGHQRGRSSQSSIEIRLQAHTETADAGLTGVESLEQAIRRMQAEVGLDYTKNAAIHAAMRADNVAELIVPARAFIPETSPEEIRTKFDHLLEMVAAIKDNLNSIQRS